MKITDTYEDRTYDSIESAARWLKVPYKTMVRHIQKSTPLKGRIFIYRKDAIPVRHVPSGQTFFSRADAIRHVGVFGLEYAPNEKPKRMKHGPRRFHDDAGNSYDSLSEIASAKGLTYDRIRKLIGIDPDAVFRNEWLNDPPDTPYLRYDGNRLWLGSIPAVTTLDMKRILRMRHPRRNAQALIDHAKRQDLFA